VIDRVRAIDEADATNATAAPLAELLIARPEHSVPPLAGSAERHLFIDRVRDVEFFRELVVGIPDAAYAQYPNLSRDAVNRAIEDFLTGFE